MPIRYSEHLVIFDKQASTSAVAKEQIIVSPDSGTSIHKKSCVGAGRVTFYTGAGAGEEEQRFAMRSWKFVIFSRCKAITIYNV